MAIRRFEDIESWQLARELCRHIYDLANSSELGRDFALKDQMFRSSGSIMNNIRFLQHAKRSGSELQNQLYRCLDQGYVDPAAFEALYHSIKETKSKIGAFIQYLTQNLDHRTLNSPR